MTQSDDGNVRRIGVLSLHNSKETKAILNAIEDLGHEPVWLRESNLNSGIQEGQVTVEPNVDIVINRLLLTKLQRPLEDLALASILNEVGDVLNPPHAVLRAMHKYNATTAMTNAGIPVPDARFSLSHDELNRARESFDDRIVQKKAIGTNGNSMSLIEMPEPVTPRVVQRRTFLQEYIDTGSPRPYDIRVYVVGGEVVGAMRREAPEGEWRTNVAQGGKVADITDSLPSTASRLARDATSLFELDYAGIDLLHADDNWYVLEVNATAGFKGLFEATGTSVAPYIARLAIERAGEGVDGARVERVAETFNDSIPACKPESNSTSTASPTIGYTEEIAVSGRDGVETVVAKADTGAKRSSIDINLAATIGAGPIKGTTAVKSAIGSGAKTRSLVDIHIGLPDCWETVTASMEDRDEMSYPILIGRDILNDYQIDVGKRHDEE